MDVERLKHGGNLTDEFFERQLEKIREIRLSERKFYQKITDIYATATQRFFAANRVKNEKLQMKREARVRHPGFLKEEHV